MKNAFLIATIVSLIIAFLSYLTSNNYFIAAAIFLIYLIYYLVFARKMIKGYLEKNRRIHNCYQFINSFIITMSVKDSLEDSFVNATQGAEGDYLDTVNELSELTPMDKVTYLRKYFNLAVYKMFINIIQIYLDQGGKLLNMSDTLIQETTRIEDTLNKTNSSIKKVAIEFVVLWLISFMVLIFLRFGISDFYMTMLSSLPFLITLVAFFILFLVSIHIYIRRATAIYIKEDSLDE